MTITNCLMNIYEIIERWINDIPSTKTDEEYFNEILRKIEIVNN